MKTITNQTIKPLIESDYVDIKIQSKTQPISIFQILRDANLNGQISRVRGGTLLR